MNNLSSFNHFFSTVVEVCVGENGQIQVGNLLPVPEDCSKFYECDVLGIIMFYLISTKTDNIKWVMFFNIT